MEKLGKVFFQKGKKKFLRSLEHFMQTVKIRIIFGNRMLFFLKVSQIIRI